MIKSSNSEPGTFTTTGIGSLPNVHPEEALKWAFSVDIPCLPDLPQSSSGALLPSGDRPPYWDEFLRKLSASPASLAKIQLFGLFTLSQSSDLEKSPDEKQEETLSAWRDRIHALVLAMAEDIRGAEKQTIFFIDEPSWARWDPRRAFHSRVKEKTEALLSAFRGSGIRTGMHCCARADFSPWLKMDLDYLSFDAALSLGDVLGLGKALKSWMDSGGRLSFGVIPTLLPAKCDSDQEVRKFLSIWNAWKEGFQRREFLSEALWTPACGLGLRDRNETERVFGALREFKTKLLSLKF